MVIFHVLIDKVQEENTPLTNNIPYIKEVACFKRIIGTLILLICCIFFLPLIECLQLRTKGKDGEKQSKKQIKAKTNKQTKQSKAAQSSISLYQLENKRRYLI